VNGKPLGRDGNEYHGPYKTEKDAVSDTSAYLKLNKLDRKVKGTVWDRDGKDAPPSKTYKPMYSELNEWNKPIEEAEYDGKKVELNKPIRGGSKKFYVYVKNDKGNVVKVSFGDPNSEIKRDDPERRSNFRSRHNCDNPGPKWKARYWSCKMWGKKNVSDITEEERMKGKDPCWDDYEMVGHKNKGGRKVPNCVPKNEDTHGWDHELLKLARQYDRDQVNMGIKVEKEHDQDPATDVVKDKNDLLKIALAHLAEDPEYYTKLADMEADFEEAYAPSEYPQTRDPYRQGSFTPNTHISYNGLAPRPGDDDEIERIPLGRERPRLKENRVEKVKAAYDSYKKMDIKKLRDIYSRSHRVSDTRGVPKSALIGDILRAEFGNKAVDAAFSLGESATPQNHPFGRNTDRIMRAAGLLNEARGEVPQEVQLFFDHFLNAVESKFRIDREDGVSQFKKRFDLDMRIFDAFRPRAGVEDDDHPDVNDRAFAEIEKIGKWVLKQNPKYKGYKFSLHPHEKYWLTASIEK
jgi:hypothetical protein